MGKKVLFVSAILVSAILLINLFFLWVDSKSPFSHAQNQKLAQKSKHSVGSEKADMTGESRQGLSPSYESSNKLSGFAKDVAKSPASGMTWIKDTSLTQQTQMAIDSGVIEFTFVLNKSGEPLSNIPVMITYGIKGMVPLKKSHKTNTKGKVAFPIASIGTLEFQFALQGYRLDRQLLSVVAGFNSYTLYLAEEKDIKVSLTTQDQKILEELQVEFLVKETVFQGRKVSAETKILEKRTLLYDAEQGVFLLKDIPKEGVYARFYAPNYCQTPIYTLALASDAENVLRVHLDLQRQLSFDLEIQEKPTRIYVSKEKYNREEVRWKRYDRVTKVVNGHEVFLGEGGLYLYSLDEAYASHLTLYVDGYLPKLIFLVPGQNHYKVVLKEGFTHKIYLKGESAKPIRGAKIHYFTDNLDQWTVSDAGGVAVLSGLPEAAYLNFKITGDDIYTFEAVKLIDISDNTRTEFRLGRGYQLSGRILLGERIIPNAQVRLSRNVFDVHDFIIVQSDEKGRYLFDHIKNTRLSALDGLAANGLGKAKLYTPYRLEAFHPDFGWGIIEDIFLNNESKELDLFLTPERSVRFEFLDNSKTRQEGLRGSIRKVTDASFVRNFDCKDKHYCFISEIEPGDYYIALDSKDYFLDSSVISIWGAQEHVFYPTTRTLHPIHALTIDGKPYNGDFDVTLKAYSKVYPLNMIHDGKTICLDQNFAICRDIFLFFHDSSQHHFLFSVPKENLCV